MPDADNDATVGLHEAFDKVHDGALIIDPDKAALALFVLRDGEVRVRSSYSTEQVADMLDQLAAKMRARVLPPEEGSNRG